MPLDPSLSRSSTGIVTGSVYAIVAVGMTDDLRRAAGYQFRTRRILHAGDVRSMVAVDYLGFPTRSSDASWAVSVHDRRFLCGRQASSCSAWSVPRQSPACSPPLVSRSSCRTPSSSVFGGGYKFFSGGYHRTLVGPWLQPGRATDTHALSFVCLFSIGLELMVTYSRMGKSMRAVSQNVESAKWSGSDVPKVVLHTFILGAWRWPPCRRSHRSCECQCLWRNGRTHHLQDAADHHHGLASATSAVRSSQQ